MPRARVPNPAANRTDLLSPKVSTTQTAPGQAYGKQTAQQQSMKIAPVGAPPAAAPAPTGGGGAGPPPAPTPPQTLPGDLKFLHPTERPNEPLTTGMPTGPGAGPEVLQGVGAQANAQQVSEQGTLQQILAHLASQPGASSVVKGLSSVAGNGPTRG